MRAAPARLTLLLSAWQSEATLPAALDSLLAQEFVDWRLVAVNDGSTDGTGAIIDEYAARDSRIEAVHQENRGLSATLRSSLDQVRTPLWGRQDADDVSHPERLARQVEFLDDHPGCDLVGTAVRLVDADGALISHVPPLHGAKLARSLPRRCAILHGSVVGRTWAAKVAGGYRPAYRYSQDYDLWLRMQEGGRLDNLSLPLYDFRVHDQQIGTARGAAQRDYAAFARLAAWCRRQGLPDPTPILLSRGDARTAAGHLEARVARRFWALRLQMAWERHAFDEADAIARSPAPRASHRRRG